MAEKLLFRGTQTPNATVVRGVPSYTPCLGAALIWSARPGGTWGERPATFLPTSTLTAITIGRGRAMKLGSADDVTVSLGDVLRALKFGKKTGISSDDARKIYSYMHNRLIGRADGGEFEYRVADEDGDLVADEDVPLSFTNPMTAISLARDEWDYDPAIATADRVSADTFVFADAPAVQRNAQRLGFQTIEYLDVFAGGTYAARELLGAEVSDIDCIEQARDFEDEVPAHWTVRTLPTAAITVKWQRPALSLVDAMRAELAASG